MTAVRRAARVIAFCAALAAIVAVLYTGHALIAAGRWLLGEPRWQWDGTSERRRGVLTRLADRARSLRARWRRTEPRHAIPPHPRPAICGPGIDPPSVPVAPWPPLPEPGFDVWAVPMAGEHLMSPAEVTEMDVKPQLRRPYTDCPREGRWVA